MCIFCMFCVLIYKSYPHIHIFQLSYPHFNFVNLSKYQNNVGKPSFAMCITLKIKLVFAKILILFA